MCYGPIKWSRHRGMPYVGQAPEHIKHARHIIGTTEGGTCADVIITFEGARADLLSRKIREYLTREFTELEIR